MSKLTLVVLIMLGGALGINIVAHQWVAIAPTFGFMFCYYAWRQKVERF